MIKGLGDRLQKQRQLLNMSQKEVATTIGVSPSVISNYESSERTPSVEILIALARLYHCSTDYLLGFEKNDDNLNVSMLDSEQKKAVTTFSIKHIQVEKSTGLF